MLKSTNIGDASKDYNMRQKTLRLRIFKCLALLTAYPVCLVREESGKLSVDVDSYCVEAARQLEELYSVQQDESLPQNSSQHTELTPESSVNDNSNAEHVHFFEAFSLQLEMECRNSRPKTKFSPLVTQQIITSIRQILENLIDDHQLDNARSPIVRRLLSSPQ
ncbi:uncharacterized protein FIESC28_07761 [Fusarium coffeatum]|uniref:Uncharacterized protein n=1 Tax=Fusarium coffeatum TaxID=231269 RepID=A0A366RB04_9HYPO|nr:uncharacterized protein FIESC28_07761 [Fusarium coffeatum]RBR14331.1 hypothetical protein FIESC28_07761 [Fusarium coffeatum]